MSRTTTIKLLCALLVCLVFPAGAHAATGTWMGPDFKTFAAKKKAGKSVTFRLKGIKQPRAVRRGYIRAGSYHRRVRATRLRRAVRRHGRARIAVRVARRAAAPRKRVRLVVVLKQVRTSRVRRSEQRDSAGAIRDAFAPTEPRQPDPAPEPAPAPSEPGTVEQPQTEQPQVEQPPVSEPAPDPVPQGGTATTRPVGSPILSDAEAASRVHRSSWEPRPGNAGENSRVPSQSDLRDFYENNISVTGEHKRLVTGNFTGTTDEIIQWAAWKWGIDEDVLRAVVVNESWWRMSAVGDGGLSFGLTQIKTTFHAGTFPMSSRSTAFNVDYYGALFRYYYEGHAKWLGDMERGEPYRAGDMWGAIGAHYAGRWHTNAADGYISDVKRHLNQRTWESRDF
ncbi:MAG TPA: hypothetical protein VD790_10470 [Thermoleophilaceae bacterium]|nr:hypothetical protein [Thermoleophilaceae bacterium]